MSDYRRGFELDIGFTDHFYTLLGITNNYDATADLDNSQITTAPAKPFPSCCDYTNHSLVTASNSGDSSATGLKSFLNGGSLPTELN
jgi:hypothetical protein